jgi:hypothetical protein
MKQVVHLPLYGGGREGVVCYSDAPKTRRLSLRALRRDVRANRRRIKRLAVEEPIRPYL